MIESKSSKMWPELPHRITEQPHKIKWVSKKELQSDPAYSEQTDDKGLREKVTKVLGLQKTELGQLVPPIDDFQADWSWTVNDVIALIHQQVRQARIDEYERYFEKYPTAPYMPDFYIKDRLKELKEENEK